MDNWPLLFSALGLAVFLEGLPCFVSPAAVRSTMQQLLQLSDRAMRAIGFSLMVVGLVLAYISLHRT